MKSAFAACFVLALAAAIAVAQPGPTGVGTAVASPVTGDGPVPFEWLIRRITVEEAEATHTPRGGKPFGFLNAKWEALKSRLRAGDELWIYRSPPASWEDLHGRMGVAVVRNGTVIDSIVTAMN